MKLYSSLKIKWANSMYFMYIEYMKCEVKVIIKRNNAKNGDVTYPSLPLSHSGT